MQHKFPSVLLWICVKEMKKNVLSNINLDFTFAFDLYAVFDMGCMLLLVPFQTVSLWTSCPASSISESLITLLSLVLWPFPGLSSTMPAPRPALSFTEATSCTPSVFLLFPAPCRCPRSSWAHLWWRLNSSLSSSVFLLIVSQVGQIESVLKLSSFSSVKFLFSILTLLPHSSIYCRL